MTDNLVQRVVAHTAVCHTAGFVYHIYLQVDIAIVVNSVIIQLDIRLKEAQIIYILLAANHLSLTIIVSGSYFQLTPQDLFFGAFIAGDVDLTNLGASVFHDLKYHIQSIDLAHIVVADICVNKTFIKIHGIHFCHLRVEFLLIEGVTRVHTKVLHDGIFFKMLVTLDVDLAKVILVAFTDGDYQFMIAIRYLLQFMWPHIHIYKAVFLVEIGKRCQVAIELFLIKASGA